ncbi:MAG: class II fructose-bisphosphate aldolase, partial [Actinomycetia bacterium]|nr:class II fructose-bisphosphate aldolase [Actinomycetes bacterium]
HSQGKEVELDFDRLKEIREATDVHLVLHGGSNMSNADIGKAIDLGVTKFNLGGILKKRYFAALRNAIGDLKDDCNVYEVIGSGFKEDILIKARIEVQRTVEKYMQLYRSAGKA